MHSSISRRLERSATSVATAGTSIRSDSITVYVLHDEEAAVSDVGTGPRAHVAAAYKRLVDCQIHPQSIDDRQCSELSGLQRNVLVLPDFEGESFQRLINTKLRIYGPLIVLSRLQTQQSLPKVDHPVYSAAMEQCRVVFTGVEADRRKLLAERVYWMGGRVLSTLDDTTTHLVADEVGSSKYKIAVHFQDKTDMPTIVKSSWIEDAWNMCARCGPGAVEFRANVSSADWSLTTYSLPPFTGLTVTVTGFVEERDLINTLVVKNGGKFTGEMNRGFTSHLIVDDSQRAIQSQKVKKAREWGDIKVVSRLWLERSAKAGKCLDEAAFPAPEVGQGKENRCGNVEREGRPPNRRRVKASTPERMSQPVASLPHPDMSGIVGAAHANNDTFMSNVSASLRHGTMADEATDRNDCHVPKPTLDEKKHIPATPVANAALTMSLLDEFHPPADVDDCLESCRIACAGLDSLEPRRADKVRRLINMSGATRCDAVHGDVTHLVVCALGDKVDRQIAQLIQKAHSLNVHVVRMQWLLDSLRLAVCQDADDPTYKYLSYPAKSGDAGGADRSVSRKRMASQVTNYGGPQPSAKQSRSETTPRASALGFDDPAIMACFNSSGTPRAAAGKSPIKSPSCRRKSPRSSPRRPALDPSRSLAQVDIDQDRNVTPEAQECSGEPGPSEADGKFWRGCTFSLSVPSRDDAEMCSRLIDEFGGKVVDPEAAQASSVDYVVVPPLLEQLPSDICYRQSVTQLWLEQCSTSGSIVPTDGHPFFRPIPALPENVTPLAGACVTPSGFYETERIWVSMLCEKSGAVVQDTFSRRAAKNHLASTHLIVKLASGNKFDAARRWGVTTVGLPWLVNVFCSGGDASVVEAVDPIEIDGYQRSDDMWQAAARGRQPVPVVNRMSTPEHHPESAVESAVAENQPNYSYHTGIQLDGSLSPRTQAPPASKLTPAVVARVTELRERRQSGAATGGSPQWDSPTVFLQKGWRPKFDFGNVLDSPEGGQMLTSDDDTMNNSAKLEAALAEGLAKAVENTSKQMQLALPEMAVENNCVQSDVPQPQPPANSIHPTHPVHKAKTFPTTRLPPRTTLSDDRYSGDSTDQDGALDENITENDERTEPAGVQAVVAPQMVPEAEAPTVEQQREAIETAPVLSPTAGKSVLSALQRARLNRYSSDRGSSGCAGAASSDEQVGNVPEASVTPEQGSQTHSGTMNMGDVTTASQSVGQANAAPEPNPAPTGAPTSGTALRPSCSGSSVSNSSARSRQLAWQHSASVKSAALPAGDQKGRMGQMSDAGSTVGTVSTVGSSVASTVVNAPHQQMRPRPPQPSKVSNPVFAFTNVEPPEERERLQRILSSLGGAVDQCVTSLAATVTHIVAGTLTRSEKTLTALAKGLWILKLEYVSKCEEEGMLLDEAAFEWTELDSATCRIPELPACCPRLRQDRQRTGRFVWSSWNVLLYLDSSKYPSFDRLLRAGGGVARSRADEIKNDKLVVPQDISHVLVDLKSDIWRRNEAVDRPALRSRRLPIYRYEYLSAFMLEADVDPNKYLIDGTESTPRAQRKK